MPGGQLVLQAPPELAPNEGAGGALMMALPMLGSVGSIVFVAAASPGGKGMIAAGMFLIATLGFVGVSVDRQRKQRAAKVGGARREYLQYLAGVRKVVRETARQQRQSLLWQHPFPSALPALAEDRSRLWERTAESPQHLQVRYGLTSQPLALELVPPETAPIEQLDPVAASALHRLLVVHRVQPNLPAAVDLRAFGRVEITGEADHARSLARAMLCSAAAFHSPDDLVVAVLASDETLPQWEWLKWLPHAHSTEDSDALGPSRMVTTSLDDLAAMLPRDLADRPRFGADQRPATPHVVVLVDGGHLPPGNHLIPDEGVHGVTVLDLPERWEELDDPTRLRLNIEPALLPDGQAAITALRMREGATRARRRPARPRQRRGVRPPPRAAAQHRGPGPRGLPLRHPGPQRPARPVRRAVLRPRVRVAAPARAGPAARARRRRRRRRPGLPRHQGVRPAGHGPARPRDRRDRLRQVGVPAHAGARPRDDPLVRGPQHGARRLQGRRDLRGALRHAARLGGHHQPRGRAHAGRPHAGRAVRRDGPAPGAAARGRQLRLGA